MSETKEQIAERLAAWRPHDLVQGDPVFKAEILAALRDVEEESDLRAREQQELAGIYKHRAEKAEAENARLREAIQRYVMVAAAHECDSDDPDKCSPDDDIWRESDTGNLRHGYGEDVSDCESVTLWEAVNAGHVTVPTFTPCVHHWYGGACEQCAEPTEEPSETKEQIAERLTIGATLRTPYEQEALILAALREVEAAAHCLRSTSQIISAEQRAEKAEAEVERLRDVLHAIAFDAGSLLAARNLALRALAAPAEGPKL